MSDIKFRCQVCQQSLAIDATAVTSENLFRAILEEIGRLRLGGTGSHRKEMFG